MRRAVLGIAVAAGLLLPAQADAYVIGGPRWAGGVLRYYSSLKDRAEVKQAARVWNKSGVHVHLIATSRSRAGVVVKSGHPPHGTGYGCQGWATQFGHTTSHATILMSRLCHGDPDEAAILAHEFGHVLGLGHETRKCALMEPLVFTHCRPAKPFEFRCRMVEADDLRGLARLYGGRVRARTGYCEQWKAPAAPTGLTVTGDRGTVLTWHSPPMPKRTPGAPDKLYLGANIYRAPAPCPARFTYEQRIDGTDALAGQTQTYTLRDSVARAGPGQWCYGVSVVDNFERGGVAKTTVTVVNKPPVASFTADPAPGIGPNCFQITDGSSDPDGSISSWSWDFGNPADPGSNQRDVGSSTEYCYQQPGTYTITLTVTDNDGATAGTSRQVQASDQPPPSSDPGFDLLT